MLWVLIRIASIITKYLLICFTDLLNDLSLNVSLQERVCKEKNLLMVFPFELEISSLEKTVRHDLACLMMPKDGIFSRHPQPLKSLVFYS